MTIAQQQSPRQGAPGAKVHLDVMNFLNEVAEEYPDAISFAAGRPAEEFFDLAALMSASAHFFQSGGAATAGGLPSRAKALLQYGRTSGLIQDSIVRQIANDEKLSCEPEQLVITAGCQEALALSMEALCPSPGDAVIVRNPTYVGGSAAAQLAGAQVYPLSAAAADLPRGIEDTISHASRQGHTVRAIYLIPDFDNPTGEVLNASERLAVLDVCARHQVVVLEDNPYGLFRYEGESIPPMAALDRHGSVIYLGTYSKTLCPAVRLGFAVIPRTLWGDQAAARKLAAEMTLRKSYRTVNTSIFSQAIVAGFLSQRDYTLRPSIEAAVSRYRANRDRLVSALASAFADLKGTVSWNRPSGGFFLTLDLPFRFGVPELKACAADHRVLVMPMSFFALDDSQDHRVRLSFSYVSPDRIEDGVTRLAAFVRSRLQGKRRCPA